MRRRSVIILGKDKAEIKIYTLRRREGYLSHQCSWHDFGTRQTKTFARLDEAKVFAQQKTVALTNGEPTDLPEVSLREIELLRSCGNRAAGFGLTVAAAIEEWYSAKSILDGGPLAVAAQHYKNHHAGIVPKDLDAVIKEFLAVKDSAGLSRAHCKSLRQRLGKIQRHLGNCPITDITTPQLDAAFRRAADHHRTQTNLRNSLIGLFRWAQQQGYLSLERKTVAERTSGFSGLEAAPAIFTPEELRKILLACPARALPHVTIGAFAGIRTAEIARLDWQDFLWERGYIEIRAAKAKTRARRLVPLHDNLRAWLEPHRRAEGAVCRSGSLSKWLAQASRDSGVPWRNNALRHSYASYRLAQAQDAPKVSLEMGNSPQMLFRHYRELVTPESATEWFGIMPGA